MKTVRVRVTRNFSRNLDGIEEFLCGADAPEAFAALLDDLFGEVIPSLETYPEFGADFFRHRATSREALAQTTELRRRLGPHTSLRELICGDYLLLYARRNQELFLLAIKHYRQLFFDLIEHWPE
jgi:plasmid stabilization system protein ParE